MARVYEKSALPNFRTDTRLVDSRLHINVQVIVMIIELTAQQGCTLQAQISAINRTVFS